MPIWDAAPFAAAIAFDRLVPVEHLEAGPFGAVMRRAGFPSRHLAGMKLRVAPGLQAQFSIGRNRGGGFDGVARHAVEALAPHLAAAVRARALLAPPGTPAQAEIPGLGDIERVALPLALIDRTPRLIHANARLRAIAARQDGLSLGRARLIASDHGADTALALAVEALLAAPPGAGPPLRSISLPRRGAALPYLVQALAIGRGGEFGRGVLLVVTDPEAARPEAALLRRVLGLTQAEAAVAAELASGGTLAAAADARGISLETARSHLKSVLGKTGCARQPDLARLLARLPAGQETA